MNTALEHITGPNFDLTKVSRVVMASIVVLILVGCKHDEARRDDHFSGLVSSELEDRHPIEVTNKSRSMKVPVSRSMNGLSYRQQNRVAGFVRDFRASDQGRLYVSAPSGSSDEVAVFNAVNSIRNIANANGVSPSSIAVRSSYSGGRSITLSYKRYVAQGPECGFWVENLARDPENVPHSEFGCATQRNLAAALADPRDLIEPRGTTPRSSERRSVTWDKYVKGESTIAQKSQQEASGISDIGN